MMYCKKCGEELPGDAGFCVRCGAPVKKEASPTTKSKILVQKCSKCGGEVIRHEELSMYGKHGTVGRAHKFFVFICEKCGYAEFFYHEKTAWQVT